MGARRTQREQRRAQAVDAKGERQDGEALHRVRRDGNRRQQGAGAGEVGRAGLGFGNGNVRQVGVKGAAFGQGAGRSFLGIGTFI